MTGEETFDSIAQEAIAAAEAVDCPFPQFVEGLETMVEALQGRLETARQEAETRREA